MKNRTLAKIKAGKPVYGFASGIGSPIATETLAASGIDFVFLDGQHGSFGMDRVIDCLLAIGGYPADAVARVPVNDFTWIGRFLDEGCVGIVVPMVNSAADAKKGRGCLPLSADRHALLGLGASGAIRRQLHR
ncbi:MAG: aldolase/citrate lyase family protein [Thermomicrobiales bacterium]